MHIQGNIRKGSLLAAGWNFPLRIRISVFFSSFHSSFFSFFFFSICSFIYHPFAVILGRRKGVVLTPLCPAYAAMRQEDEEEEGVGRGCSLGPSNGEQCRTERESTTAKVGHPSSVFSSSRHRHLGSIFQPISDLPSFLPYFLPSCAPSADSPPPHPDGSVVNRSHERQ